MVSIIVFSPTFLNAVRFQADFIYLDISCVPLAVSPRAANAREGPLRVVKLVIVSVEEKCGEGLLQVQERTSLFQKTPWASGVCVETAAES